MAHLTQNKLLITIPSLIRPGVESITPAESGKEEANQRITVILPKGSFVNGKDVSLFTLNIEMNDLDPVSPLPYTHCFYVSADRQIILSRTISKKTKQGRPVQRTRQVRCRAYELQAGIMQACRLQRPPENKRPKHGAKHITLLETLAQRAEIAKLVSQHIGSRR